MYSFSFRRYMTAGLVFTMTALAVIGSWMQQGGDRGTGLRPTPPLATVYDQRNR